MGRCSPVHTPELRAKKKNSFSSALLNMLTFFAFPVCLLFLLFLWLGPTMPMLWKIPSDWDCCWPYRYILIFLDLTFIENISLILEILPLVISVTALWNTMKRLEKNKTILIRSPEVTIFCKTSSFPQQSSLPPPSHLIIVLEPEEDLVCPVYKNQITGDSSNLFRLQFHTFSVIF